jgi:hypothetical protein
LGTVNWVFNEIPAISDVELRVLQCQQVAPQPPPNGTCDWIELAVDLVEYPPIENRWKILVDVNYPTAPPSWRYSGFITFTATTPPACCPLTDGPCAPLCEQPFEPPDTNIYRIPDASRCNDTTVKDIPAGVFTPHYWGLGDGEEVIATPCQDPMTGNIKFKFATNQRTSIDLPYNLELCPDRIAYLNLTRIDSEEEFDIYLEDSIDTKEKACTLRQWILNHKGFDKGKQTGGEIHSQNGIWITASTLAHEYEHERDYEKALREKINIFYKYYDNYSIECSTYVQDTENAKTIAGNNFKAQLFEFSYAARSYYESNLDEVELNGRDTVQEAIEPYLTMLHDFIEDEFGAAALEEIKDYCPRSEK